MAKFIKAERGLHNSVIYTTTDGKYFRYMGGTWPWRTNNPGDIHSGDFTKKHNQIGIAGKLAVFPDYGTGEKALIDLLKTPVYQNKSIDQLVDRYAPPKNGNKHNAEYKAALHKATGVMDDTKIKYFTPEQFDALWHAIINQEGYYDEKPIDGYPRETIEVYKITCTQNDKKNVISKYCVNTIGWITKDECIKLVKQGVIEAEICTSKSSELYLRTNGHSNFQKNFDDLLEKKP